MRKLLGLIVLAALFVHCGGEEGTSEDPGASRDAPGSVGGSEVDSDEPAALIRNPVTGASVGANAGYAANGTVLTIPTGFTVDQCRFTAALATMDGSALSAQVGINETTGEVVCRKVVQERVEIPPEIQDCTAAFTVICVK